MFKLKRTGKDIKVGNYWFHNDRRQRITKSNWHRVYESITDYIIITKSLTKDLNDVSFEGDHQSLAENFGTHTKQL